MFLSFGISSKALLSRRVQSLVALVLIPSRVGWGRQASPGSWVRQVVAAAEGRLGAAVRKDVSDPP